MIWDLAEMGENVANRWKKDIWFGWNVDKIVHICVRDVRFPFKYFSMLDARLCIDIQLHINPGTHKKVVGGGVGGLMQI